MSLVKESGLREDMVLHSPQTQGKACKGEVFKEEMLSTDDIPYIIWYSRIEDIKVMGLETF